MSTKCVEISVGPGKPHVDTDFDALRFAPPRDVGESGEACVARAYMMPGRSALRVNIAGCEVVKVRESRKNTPTVIASTCKSALAMLMALDEHILGIAKANIDAWFLHKMNADLVEEYYRGNSATDLKRGVLARFVLEGKLASSVQDGRSVDMTLQLIGVQFRRQYFTPMWKLVSATPSVVVAPSAKNAKCRFLDADDDEGCDEEGGDDDGPSMEECVDLRETLMAQLFRMESQCEERMKNIRELVCMLEASALDDMRTLEECETCMVDMENNTPT
jgi:hypothetical protein